MGNKNSTRTKNLMPKTTFLFPSSLLNFREAVAAKTLSSRWRRLDSDATVISLDAPFALEQQQSSYGVYIQSAKNFHALSNEHISSIHRTLESLEGCRSIARFKIDLPSVRRFDYNLVDYNFPKWLRFALSRETEIIDLRMIYDASYPEYVNFPLHKIVKKMHSLRAVKCLKELHFFGVRLIDSNRDADALTNFISKFDVLERLSIESPIPLPVNDRNHLHDLRLNGVVGGSVSSLKYLSISKFARVISIRVSDRLNLVSLKCHGLEPYALYLHNLPKLADASITNANLDQCGSISGIPDRAHVRLDRVPGNLGFHVPPFTQLKHLELDIAIDGVCNTLPLFLLFQKCPSMEYLEIMFLCSSNVGSDFRRIDKDRVLQKAEIKELKTLKLLGFPWSVTELEFLLFVVKNATKLKEVIIEAPHKNCQIQPSTRAFRLLQVVILLLLILFHL